MELRVLRYFLVVAEQENITRAAESLHITQPTLSRQMKQLEVELSVPLFVRNARSTVLTEYGKRLQIKAKELLENADDISHMFAEEKYKSGCIILSPFLGKIPDLRSPLSCQHSSAMESVLTEAGFSSEERKEYLNAMTLPEQEQLLWDKRVALLRELGRLVDRLEMLDSMLLNFREMERTSEKQQKREILWRESKACSGE